MLHKKPDKNLQTLQKQRQKFYRYGILVRIEGNEQVITKTLRNFGKLIFSKMFLLIDYSCTYVHSTWRGAEIVFQTHFIKIICLGNNTEK